MRKLAMLSVVLCVAVSSGCLSKPIQGTWIKDKSSDSKSPIAAVSFCGDGTFTAHAEYGDNTSHVVSGHYSTNKGRLVLDAEGKNREYGYDVSGDTLTLTHEGKSSSMSRMKPR